jgi:hypothetical protein
MAICPLCPGTKKVPTTKGYCQRHYWEQNRMKSALKAQEKELQQDEDLQTLVSDLDIIFSRYIRLKDADLYGRIECYCCGEKVKWTMADASHFIPRAHMYTRFLEMNVKPCCQGCNRAKDGNLAAFAGHLERDNPGSVEILQEQARIVQHWSRDELRAMIAEYDKKLKQVQKGVLK